MDQRSQPASLAAIVSVFFFWGFLAASNGIFIPFCKTHFDLSQFQSQLIDSAFYGAYFIGSLMLYMYSLSSGKDLINRIGYKRTIITGLAISVLGAIMMLPAVHSGSFLFILSAFFMIALGFSLQQTSANPLVLNLGDPAKGATRLNLAGSVNSWGTTAGPILISSILFGKAIASDADKVSASLSSINVLYVILAIAFAAAILVLVVSRIPRLNIEEEQSGLPVLRQPLYFICGTLLVLSVIFFAGAADPGDDDQGKRMFLVLIGLLLLALFAMLVLKAIRIGKEGRFSPDRNPQVLLGMLAIFVYVGVEVTIQSNLGALLVLPEFGALDSSAIGPYISIYWGSLMIGRWTGAIGVFNLGKTSRLVLTFVVPYVAFAVVLFMNWLGGSEVSGFYTYGFCILLLIGGFLLGKERPAFTLVLFSVLGAAAMMTGLLTTGQVSVYAFLCGGLFCSIMWPCIFSLATAGLGPFTSQASGFLIMMILGGAFIPPLQGLMADEMGIHISYIIPLVCFLFLAWYAFKVKALLAGRGINYDAPAGGH